MKSPYIVVLLFCLAQIACRARYECLDCDAAPVEINVVIADMSGKPLTNKKVTAEGFRINQAAISDINGRVSLSFKWFSDPDAGQKAWRVSVAEANDSYKTLDFIEGPSYTPLQKYTINDTIKMDTLKTMSVRLKTNRSDVRSISVNADIRNDYSATVKKKVERTLGSFSVFTNTPQLDTTVQIKVFAKAAFQLSSSMYFGNNPLNTRRDTTIKAFANRDSVVFVF